MTTFFLVQKVAAFIVVWFMEILQLLLFRGLRFVIAGELLACQPVDTNPDPDARRMIQYTP